MAIDFTLAPAQRKLRLKARKFANKLLADARAAASLALLCLGASPAGNVEELTGFLIAPVQVRTSARLTRP